MAQTKYTYSLANDTLNGEVDINKLTRQIHAEGSGVVISVDYMNVDASQDLLDIFMADTLADDVAGTSVSLASIVSAHDGIPDNSTQTATPVIVEEQAPFAQPTFRTKWDGDSAWVTVNPNENKSSDSRPCSW